MPLAAIAADTGIVHVRDALDSVDPDARRVVTQDRAMIGYDALVLAVGARPRVAVPGALTFRGPRDVPRVSVALSDLEQARGGRVAFVVPGGVTWPLPLYELALLTGAWAQRASIPLELQLVTTETRRSRSSARTRAPTSPPAGRARRRGAHRDAGRGVDDGRLWLARGWVPADVAIALPELAGSALPGLPHDDEGFTPVDDYGRVDGLDDVYAVGDMTARPIKQGGLAAQQADSAAAAIAARRAPTCTRTRTGRSCAACC